MKKTFCDVCNKEVTRCAPSLNAELRFTKLKIEVIAYVVDNSDSDVCMYCVIDALNRLDDRDRPTHAKQIHT